MMLALSVMNHLIQQNAEIKAQLTGYNGIVLAICTAGVRINGRFNEHGLLEHSDRPADTTLTFHNSVWQKILQGDMPSVGDFDIAGDMALGFRLLPLIGSLRYDAQYDLSRVLGHEAARHLTVRAQKVGYTLKHIGQSLINQTADYAREPQAPLITREEFDEWTAEVDKLRDDIARLHARLDKLDRDWD